MSRCSANAKKPPTAPTIRCAIYTRKSSDEGLQQEFNSLDAQREAAEAYVASQKAEGWTCLRDRYDDGGFTGGNMERPALQRLLADIEAGRIDCVVVYKVDRLSRSLMDFARIMETFERHSVSFVSVTQHFNTTHSMGRLTLNILLSFAQFEREIIGERIRDKIAASRQKGKWTGGTPILGYDVDRSNGSPKLVINPVEASRVREIFNLYLELGSLLPVVVELERCGWCNKAWTTRDGRRRGGLPFDKCRLHNLLTNVLYIGKTRHKDQVHAGEHEAIVPEDVFLRVQKQLQHNGRNGASMHRNRHGALLRGLLRCKACGKAMSHAFTTQGNRRYRYYVCGNRTKRGQRACPSGSVPAVEIENAVVDQIRCVGEDRELRRETLRQARAQVEGAIQKLSTERRALERGKARLLTELRQSATTATSSETTARIADLNDQVRKADQRLADIDAEMVERKNDRIDEADVNAALGDFNNVWKNLSPREQVRVMELLVASIEFDATEGTIEVTFHETGIKALADQARAEDKAEEAA